MKGEQAFPNPLQQGLAEFDGETDGSRSTSLESKRPPRAAFEADGQRGESRDDVFDSEEGKDGLAPMAIKGAMVTRQFGTDALSNMNAMFATTFFTKTDETALTDSDYKMMWFGLLHPHAPLRRAYNAFHIVILLYMLYVLPKRICFGQVAEGLMVEIDAIIDILVFVDIVINFRAYYFDKRNILVVHRKAIRSKYLRTWFAIDFLAIVPADQVVLIVATSINSDVLKSWVSTIRLSRLLRIIRLANLNSMLQTRRLKKNIVHIMTPLGFSAPLIDFIFTVGFLVGFLLTACHIFGACEVVWLRLIRS
jgi:hyperpolarization activated cyclic nucleotide-gated potassium channel 3